MAFASAVVGHPLPLGDLYLVRGTFTNTAGSTGGDVATGLSVVEEFLIQESDNAVIASKSAVNETLPLDGGDVTIVTVADVDGRWIALGRF